MTICQITQIEAVERSELGWDRAKEGEANPTMALPFSFLGTGVVMLTGRGSSPKRRMFCAVLCLVHSGTCLVV